MTYVKVNYDSYSELVEEGDGEQWGRRDCYHDYHTIESISQVDEKGYHDLSVDFELHPLEEYYLVYVLYSTGDSFGHDGGRIEFVGLFKNEKVAIENVRRIQEHDRIYNESNRYHSPKKLPKGFKEFTVTLVTEKGKKFDVHVPWHGYFEELEDIRCEAVMVRC